MTPAPAPRTAAAPQVETENTAGFPETLLAANGRALQGVKEVGSDLGFYADPKLITYHHYVEFLNEVADRVGVSDGIVKSNDTIWICIGEADGGTNPILYIGGRFQLRSAERAPDPVVRVIWKGAQAYAAYYGLQLPTYAQWQILLREPGFAPQGERPSGNSTPQSVHGHMMGASGTMNAVSNSSQTFAGGTTPVHKEWVTTSNETIRSGVADREHTPSPPDPVHRHPWEAFGNVGVRMVRDAG